MNLKLEQLLMFVEFTNKFASIKRGTVLNKDGGPENNSQHSFQMAIVAWFIAEKDKLDLDKEKLIKYSLVHDLMETYSGTFPAYSRTKSKELLKKELEAKAINKIKKDFSGFGGLITAFNAYLQQTDEESKFIYALDKLIPIINIELNNNDFYFRTKTTYEDMLKVKDGKIAKHSTIYKYFKILRKYLKTEKNFFWPENKNRDYSNKDYIF